MADVRGCSDRGWAVSLGRGQSHYSFPPPSLTASLNKVTLPSALSLPCSCFNKKLDSERG